jgi:hypothetical protein
MMDRMLAALNAVSGKFLRASLVDRESPRLERKSVRAQVLAIKKK